MTARDNRGRFVSDDAFAAERVLEAAVREAVAILRAGADLARELEVAGNPARGSIDRYNARGSARVVLAHAAHAVEPLLRSAS